MTDLAKAVFDEIGAAIEEMPVDGLTCDGQQSEDLRREQRQFIAGMRYARLKAFKLIRNTKEQSD